MTWFQYMTGDVPFAEKENEYVLAYTVAEALEKGIALSDREKSYPPNVRIIKQLDGYDTVGFSVRPFEKYSVDMRDTEKAFCADLWYISTLQQAEGLLHYLQDYMKQNHEVEIWHLFQGSHTHKPYEIETKTRSVSLSALTAELLYQFFLDCDNAPQCIVVRND